MANIREITKRDRITRLKAIFHKAKDEQKEIDKNKLIALLIVEYGISKKTAVEEIDAVMNYE
jgi:hypothetical protein